MKNVKTIGGYWPVALALLASLISHPASLRAQGSLTPSGVPAPSMKTLAQIEARTPVDAINTPGNASEQFTISQPGSYYLTGNIIGVNGEYGISIQTNDVTLDLNGFQMVGVSTSLYGIVIGTGQNIVIHDGTLRNWRVGVEALKDCCELEHLRVYDCQSYGFYLAAHCTVKHCTVSENGSAGMIIGNDGLVADCLVSSNATGISGGSDCTISGSQANYNLNDGIDLADNFNINQCAANGNGGSGFHLGNNGQVNHCNANTNGDFNGLESYGGIIVQNGCAVNDCNACGNFAGGGHSRGGGMLIAGNGCIVKNCTASGSIGGDGIDVFDNNCSINNCNATANSAYGIDILGGQNRIDNNNVGGNGNYGIWAALANETNSITRNSSFGSGYGNYGGNSDYAPIQTPSAATSPWANF